jgi:hypothetical protein
MLSDRSGADAKAVNEARRHLDWAYSEVGYAAINATGNPRLPDGTKGPGLSLDSVPPEKQPMAQKILDAFAQAKLGQFQQVAALANAIAESALNPNARIDAENSWGLFMLNRNGGFGMGYTPGQLQDPDTNIGIVVREALKNQRFAAANSLDAAVEIFVREILRPANLTSETIRRQQIARQLLRS